jgi:hypothetical protein
MVNTWHDEVFFIAMCENCNFLHLTASRNAPILGPVHVAMKKQKLHFRAFDKLWGQNYGAKYIAEPTQRRRLKLHCEKNCR